MTFTQVLKRFVPDDTRDPVATAASRLRCYYECVTRDLGPDDLDDTTDDDDLEDEFSLSDW